jgi:5-formyl-3-hydroxy-2-methylpyridine 4-carboxylic acid 5-dehydrogenase
MGRVMAPTPSLTVAIIGAGTMGPDVAAIFARHGHNVRVMDLSAEALGRVPGRVAAALDTLVAGGLLTQDEADAAPLRITYVADLAEAVSEAHYVLEAIPEVLEVKRRLFQQLETLVQPDAILASNSSGIPIDEIARSLERPGQVIGTHWLNQPHVIPVVEVVQGPSTLQSVADETLDLLRGLDMIPVLIRGNLPGFVHNRILFAVYREVLHMVSQGLVSAEDIDDVTKWAIGPKLTAVGPFEMLDVAGLDVYQSIARYLNADLNADPGVSPVVEERVANGALGIKAGRGMYEYADGQTLALMRQRQRLMLDIVRMRLQTKGGC